LTSNPYLPRATFLISRIASRDLSESVPPHTWEGKNSGDFQCRSLEPLLRSDVAVISWRAPRLRAREELLIDQVGGNAIFVNNHDRRIVIRRCHIAEAGANGVALVWDPQAVRNPLFECSQRQSLKRIDLAPGPKADNYAASRHQHIRGTLGEHVIEYNDVFDTVKETGDHGSFNSWGRDRDWQLKDVDANTIAACTNLELQRLDAAKPVILRNNRWRAEHGWDVDLDDASTNCHIYNNLT
jgi:hypothetical protein